MKELGQAILGYIKNFGTNMLESIVVLLIAIILMKIAKRLIRAILNRTKVEGAATSFIISIVQAALSLIAFFIILRIFKVDTSGAVAIVAASGLAVGLALQDSISNVAGGVILLFTKPFKEDDHVIIGSTEGKIRKIKITTIEILSFDNILITIPNNKVVSSEIQNLSARSSRRISLTIPVSYKEDIAKVKETLSEIINADERILNTPSPAVEISAIKDYFIEYKVKFWVNRQDYWSVNNNFNEKVLLAFKEKGMSIPFSKYFEHQTFKVEGGEDA